MWISQRRQGVKFPSGADAPLEVVSGLYYWRTEPVWPDMPASCIRGVSIGWSVNYMGPSLNLIQRNVPQSNVTWPNKSNVVTVTVFGNVYEEKYTADIRGVASVLPPVLPTQIDRRTPGKHLENTSTSSSWRHRHASLGAAVPAFCVNSWRFVFNAEMLRSVWITIGGELANRGCGFYVSSPVWMGLMTLQYMTVV